MRSTARSSTKKIKQATKGLLTIANQLKKSEKEVRNKARQFSKLSSTIYKKFATNSRKRHH